MGTSCTPANLVRALRLPFTTASALPFILGSLIPDDGFHPVRFLLGFVAAVGTHLSANVMNDYADSRSGADWKDLTFYGFFGGSKLIQRQVLSERFYLRLSIALAAASAAAVVALAILMKSVFILFAYAVILLLAWSYSAPPLRLSYRRLGEPVIFLLFGPAAVMGGHFIQTGVFPTAEGFLLALPLGFLTTAILYGNEIPDYADDRAAGKRTWVSFTGPENGYAVYAALIACGLASVVACVAFGHAGRWALVALAAAAPAFLAARTLKSHCCDKAALVQASRWTILAQMVAGMVLIADRLLLL